MRQTTEAVVFQATIGKGSNGTLVREDARSFAPTDTSTRVLRARIGLAADALQPLGEAASPALLRKSFPHLFKLMAEVGLREVYPTSTGRGYWNDNARIVEEVAFSMVVEGQKSAIARFSREAGLLLHQHSVMNAIKDPAGPDQIATLSLPGFSPRQARAVKDDLLAYIGGWTVELDPRSGVIAQLISANDQAVDWRVEPAEFEQKVRTLGNFLARKGFAGEVKVERGYVDFHNRGEHYD